MKTIRADEYCKFVTDGTHDSPKQVNKGRKLITSKHLGRYGIDFKGAKNISESDYQKVISRSKVEQWDILFSMIGTIGNLYLERNHKIEYACKNMGIFQLGGDESKAKWLYYYLQTPKAKEYIETSGRGTTQSYVPLAALRALPVDVVDDFTRDKIIKILWDIDEKILTNQQVNKNLADQSQAIYQQYFVAEANPDWPLGHLSDLIDIKYGKDHKKLADGTYPVYGSGGIMRYVERPLYEKESVLIPRKGTLNNVIYVNQPFWSVDTMFYTEMKQDNVAKFVYHYVKSKDLASMNAGSAVPSMTTAILNALELPLPSIEALKHFEISVAPMYEMMQKNEEESHKLAKLRDALLPKLMSGELDVSNVEI